MIGQTEVVLINKDQKDRSSRIRPCVLLTETVNLKPVSCGEQPLARERANLPDLYENTTYSVVVNE